MGPSVGRLLSAAEQPERYRCQDALEALHPIDRSGMGVSHHQGRTRSASDLASQRGPCTGTHSGLFLGLCDVENTRRLDEPQRAGRRSTEPVGRVLQDQVQRHHAADPHRGGRNTRAMSAMRNRTRCRAETAPPSTRIDPAKTPRLPLRNQGL